AGSRHRVHAPHFLARLHIERHHGAALAVVAAGAGHDQQPVGVGGAALTPLRRPVTGSAASVWVQSTDPFSAESAVTLPLSRTLVCGTNTMPTSSATATPRGPGTCCRRCSQRMAPVLALSA